METSGGKPKSRHDIERDRIAATWAQLSPVRCAVCREELAFPPASTNIEVQYDGRLRADVGAFDGGGQLLGVVEVVRSHPPTERAIAAQKNLGFAYYRKLPLPALDELAVWLCSPDCWEWRRQWGEGAAGVLWEAWKAPQCARCNGYIHQNQLSWLEFRDWDADPHEAYCIHCAAAYGRGQWRAPGELAGGDPREWTPDNDADPAALFFAYGEAEFWAMVWTKRVVIPDEPRFYYRNMDNAVEEATARRLLLVQQAFDNGEWGQGSDLLLPVGAPGWQSFPDERERLLAYRPDNCRGVAAAWNRLLSYRLGQLPDELADIIFRAHWLNCSQCGRPSSKESLCGELLDTCYICDEPPRKAAKERWELERRHERQEALAKEQEALARKEAEQRIEQERRNEQIGRLNARLRAARGLPRNGE